MTRGRQGRIAYRLALGLVLGLGAAGGADAACPGGRFVLSGRPLAIGGAGAAASTLVLGEGVAELTGVCGTIQPKRYRTNRNGFTVVRARWDDCPGVRGRVRLKGKIDPGCGRIVGRLKGRGFRQRVDGALSTCGDGLLDVDAREMCEPPSSGLCNSRCQIAVDDMTFGGVPALGTPGPDVRLDGELLLDSSGRPVGEVEASVDGSFLATILGREGRLWIEVAGDLVLDVDPDPADPDDPIIIDVEPDLPLGTLELVPSEKLVVDLLVDDPGSGVEVAVDGERRRLADLLDDFLDDVEFSDDPDEWLPESRAAAALIALGASDPWMRNVAIAIAARTGPDAAPSAFTPLAGFFDSFEGTWTLCKAASAAVISIGTVGAGTIACVDISAKCVAAVTPTAGPLAANTVCRPLFLGCEAGVLETNDSAIQAWVDTFCTPPTCGDSRWPICDGTCPDGQRCVPRGGCTCVSTSPPVVVTTTTTTTTTRPAAEPARFDIVGVRCGADGRCEGEWKGPHLPLEVTWAGNPTFPVKLIVRSNGREARTRFETATNPLRVAQAFRCNAKKRTRAPKSIGFQVLLRDKEGNRAGPFTLQLLCQPPVDDVLSVTFTLRNRDTQPIHIALGSDPDPFTDRTRITPGGSRRLGVTAMRGDTFRFVAGRNGTVLDSCETGQVIASGGGNVVAWDPKGVPPFLALACPGGL